jgi:hypothetical protein
MSDDAIRPPLQSADPADEQEAIQQREAASVIVKMTAAEQAVRLYDVGNDAVTSTLGAILTSAKIFATTAGEPLELSLFGYTFCANQRLLRLDFETYRKAGQLKRSWNRVGLAKLTIPPNTTMAELQNFASQWVTALNQPEHGPSFLAGDYGAIQVFREQVGSVLSGALNADEYLTRCYCALLALMRQIVGAFAEGKTVSMVRVKRLLQVLVDHLDGYRGLLLALTVKPELRGDLAAHLLATAIYSLLFGRALGFDRNQLVSLGMAALSHDLPKAGLNPTTIAAIEQPAKLAAEDRSRVALHWISRLQQLLMA